MSEYRSHKPLLPETTHEILDSLRLRRLGYDLNSGQLLLEGHHVEYDDIFQYESTYVGLPRATEIEGAMIGVMELVFIGTDTVDKGKELLANSSEELEEIATTVQAAMKEVFDRIYPDLFEDMEPNDMLSAFRLGVNDQGVPTFVTFGECACLGYDPHGLYSSFASPLEQLTFHNIDTRANKTLGKAQFVSLTAGLAAYTELLREDDHTELTLFDQELYQ